jgi:putative hydrolase of the HAD superfamily
VQTQAPQALLFDLGGVLVDIDFSRALANWASFSPLPINDLRRAFKFDHQYERHERGEIDATEYFDHIKSTLQLTASTEEVEFGWNSIFVGEIAATRELVEAARQSLPCFAFTNTNVSHMARWSQLFPKVVGAFDHIFASHEIGLRKPERAAFEHICQATSLEPHKIIFFDDLQDNVHAASVAGFRSVLVRSPGDVANTLRTLVPSKA